jgi:prevent-host-death family protein
MKEREIGAGEFKAHCLQLIDEVSHTRNRIVVTKHGKPMAMLVPYANKESSKQPSLFGCLQNTVLIHGDIVAGTGESWQADE